MNKMEEELAGCTLALGGIALSIAAIAVGVVYEGWVLSVMWGWFIVPLGLPRIAVAHAIGVALVMALLTKPIHGNKDDDDDKKPFINTLKKVATAFFVYTVFLGIGYIVVGYM